MHLEYHVIKINAVHRALYFRVLGYIHVLLNMDTQGSSRRPPNQRRSKMTSDDAGTKETVPIVLQRLQNRKKN